MRFRLLIVSLLLAACWVGYIVFSTGDALDRGANTHAPVRPGHGAPQVGPPQSVLVQAEPDSDRASLYGEHVAGSLEPTESLGSNYNPVLVPFEFEGVAFEDLDLNSMEIGKLDSLKKALREGIRGRLREIRARPRHELSLLTGAEYDALEMRWSDELCTHYSGSEILRIERGRDPDVYEHASRIKAIYHAAAYRERLDRQSVDFEEAVRRQYEGHDLSFVYGPHGLSIYVFRAGDEGGELLTELVRPLL